MRKDLPAILSAGRVRSGPLASNDTFGLTGAFIVPCPDTHRELKLVASNGRDWIDAGLAGEAWEHVSVSLNGRPDRAPSWPEMAWVKTLFWTAEELVVQFHPPESVYVHRTGDHVGVLHLWRPTVTPIPLPPQECV